LFVVGLAMFSKVAENAHCAGTHHNMATVVDDARLYSEQQKGITFLFTSAYKEVKQCRKSANSSSLKMDGASPVVPSVTIKGFNVENDKTLKALNNSLTGFQLVVNGSGGTVEIEGSPDVEKLSPYDREMYEAITNPSKSLTIDQETTSIIGDLKKLRKNSYSISVKLSVLFADNKSYRIKEISRALFGGALREFNTGSYQAGLDFQVSSFYALYNMEAFYAYTGNNKRVRVNGFYTGVDYERTIVLGKVYYKQVSEETTMNVFAVNVHIGEATRFYRENTNDIPVVLTK